MRRALCAVIGSFRSGEEEPGIETPPDIPGADELRAQMKAALRRLGYECEVPDGPLPAEQLGATIEAFLDAPMPCDGLRIVHVLSRGLQLDNYDELRVLGSDGRHHRSTAVERWLKHADEDPNGPATLFLLDVCHAGKAVQLPHQLAVRRRRTVVLAASTGDEAAYDAGFTRAVIAALGKVADGGYDVARGSSSIALRQVALDVQAQVAHGHGQQVSGTLFSLLEGEPDLAFFPNLRPAEADLLPEGIDPGVGDLGLDPGHFIDRAFAHGPRPRMRTGLLFQGRERLLKELSEWLDTPGPPAPGQGMRVVTGSPGSGKSALLGVLVCAAHPGLREATDPAWNRLEHVPSRNEHLVAVHARQLTTQQVIDSLARQLRLPLAPHVRQRKRALAGDASRLVGGSVRVQKGWTVEELLEGIAGRPVPPVIVIDAVDEAAQPGELIRQLLLPLSDRTWSPSSSSGGRCRLLVGTRARKEFRPLLQAAREHGRLIDLDDEPSGEVRTALTQYVAALLERQPPYDTPAYKSARACFAHALATALTPEPTPGATPLAADVLSRSATTAVSADADGPRWGAFLVAALYTHHKITSGELTPDPEHARMLGGQVPRTLPAVMEMDLQARREDVWARPLLAALAYARGDGMPVDVLARVAPVFHPDGPDVPEPTDDQIRRTLKAIRFYLRLTPDQHGIIHYRLFHQGLTDYLRHHPIHRSDAT